MKQHKQNKRFKVNIGDLLIAQYGSFDSYYEDNLKNFSVLVSNIETKPFTLNGQSYEVITMYDVTENRYITVQTTNTTIYENKNYFVDGLAEYSVTMKFKKS